jgi:Tfp pilus assembly protein PilV
LKGLRVEGLKRNKPLHRFNALSLQGIKAFALYEVILGVTVFVIGVLALGRSLENCMHASSLNAEEDRVRQILSNRMAEIQATPGLPDDGKKFKVDSGYGIVEVTQQNKPANLKEDDGKELNGISIVTVTAEWSRSGVKQSRAIQFFIYRNG